MEQRTWRGYWWPPDEPDAALPGILHCAADGRVRLELIGGFDTEIREPLPGGGFGYAVSMESRTFPLLHGSSGSERFTLLDTHASHTSGVGFFSGDIVKQNLSPLFTLRGVHLDAVDEPAFARTHVQLERLLEWSAQSTFNLQVFFDTTTEREMERKAATKQVPALTAAYESTTIRLRVRSNEFNITRRPLANRRSMETQEWATLDFERPEPVSFSVLDTIDKDVQDLLTLASYAPCGSLGQSLVVLVQDERLQQLVPKEVEVISRQIYRSDVVSNEKQLHHFLFTLADCDFSSVVPAWLALKDQARVGFNLMFGLRYIATGYVGTRLLGVATAAESIHRGLCPRSKPMAETAYKALKQRLLSAIEDESQATRDYVNSGLRNDATFNTRMLELAAIPDTEAVDRLLTNRNEWAKRLKNARNDLAHANERSSADADSSEAFWLLEVTFALLCLVVLEKLDLGADVQRRALEHPEIQWTAHQFRKQLEA